MKHAGHSSTSAAPAPLHDGPSDGSARAVGREPQERFVVFADMVGYSALSSREELSTHVMWMDFRRTCLDPTVAIHGGTVVRMLGDGCLLTFPTADSALAWCLDLRRRILDDRVGAGTRWPNLTLRFGAHVADVICEGDDIYGAGVNVTKRIQERAHGDGVLVSDALVERLSPGHGCELRFLGALEYRNIADPLPTHEVVFRERSVPLREDTGELPSIAVMPLLDRTGADDLDWFTDGVIDDIIQSLSSLKELRVISRNSTVPLAQRTRDPAEIARILSVRYVVSGSLVGNGERGRVFVTLEDAVRGETLFSEKCEFSHSQLFDVQDTLVRRIVGRITPGVRSAELEKALRKPPVNFTAYQNTLRALDLMKTLDREDFYQARRHLDEAHRLDPGFALPVAWLARWYCVLIGQHWADDRERAIEEAEDAARLAVSIDRENPMALAVYGHVRSYLKRDFDTALVYFDRARQLSPSHALTWMLSSGTLSYVDRGEEAYEHAKMSLMLSPNDFEMHWLYDFASMACLLSDRIEEAVSFGEMSRTERGGNTSNLKTLIMANNLLGDRERASKLVREFLALDPDFTVSTYRRTCPLAKPERIDWCATQLEQAGMPH